MGSLAEIGSNEWLATVARLFGMSTDQISVDGVALLVTVQQCRMDRGVALLNSRTVAT